MLQVVVPCIGFVGIMNQCIELVLLQGMDLSTAGFYQCMLCTASSSCGLTLLI